LTCLPAPARPRHLQGFKWPGSAKQQAKRPHDCKREKRSGQNEKQSVDAWIDHDAANSFRRGTAATEHRREIGRSSTAASRCFMPKICAEATTVAHATSRALTVDEAI